MEESCFYPKQMLRHLLKSAEVMFHLNSDSFTSLEETSPIVLSILYFIYFSVEGRMSH